jgi:hypothetical protein
MYRMIDKWVSEVSEPAISRYYIALMSPLVITMIHIYSKSSQEKLASALRGRW